MGHNYFITCRENGDVIEKASSYEEALSIIAEYESSDKEDGTYTDNFYEIVEN